MTHYFSFVDNFDGKFVKAIIELPFAGETVTDGWLPNILVRDGSLFMGMTGSDKKWPGHEKFCSWNDGLWNFKIGKMTGFWKETFNQ